MFRSSKLSQSACYRLGFASGMLCCGNEATPVSNGQSGVTFPFRVTVHFYVPPLL
jgi:hypothetical protein